MYNEAIAGYTRAIAIDPAWYHYFSRAQTKIEMGDRKGGCADFDMMPDPGIPEVRSTVDLYDCPK